MGGRIKPETRFRVGKVDPFFKEVKKKYDIYMETINQKTIHGTPDKLGCINSWFVAVEIKTDTGNLSAVQEVKMHRILDAGGYYFVVTPSNFEAFKKAIWDLCEGKEL